MRPRERKLDLPTYRRQIQLSEPISNFRDLRLVNASPRITKVLRMGAIVARNRRRERQQSCCPQGGAQAMRIG